MAEGLEAQLEVLTQENAFLKKYLALRKKCEQLQQANEKLVNRLQHVKKLVKRYKRETRFLSTRLDGHSDNYREAQVPVMWEEDQMFSLLRPPPPYQSPGKEAPPAAKPKAAKKVKLEDKSHDQSHDRPSASILSSLQPLFLAHGVGQNLESKASHGSKLEKVKLEMEEDSGLPKKPTKAYLMFCDQYRDVVQEEYVKEHHEEIPHLELTKRLALRWNALSQNDKKVFFDLFEQEKEKYELEMQQLAAVGRVEPREITPTGQYSEAVLAAMQLESDNAVSSLLVKQEQLN